MSFKFLQSAPIVALAACGAAPTSTQAQTAARPFTITEVAQFNAPWAMDFLPGSGVPVTGMALVTEKGGKLWLVDSGNGKKQEVSGVPAVRAQGQGGLLDVAASPGFAGDGMIYMTYAEPSPAGGSGLALARARLVDLATAPQLTGLQVIWRNPTGGQGGHFGARVHI